MNKIEKIKKRQQDYMHNGFIIAEFKGEVVGFCRYIDNNSFTPETPEVDCEILAIYVALDFKNKGIGRKLFDYVKEEFAKKNKNKMVLWCLKDNETSRKY